MQMLDKHQFPDGVDPYREKGNPESGLLWGIMEGDMGQTGQGDKRVQAYNFRITMTNDPHNRIPITRPENYDSTRYELLVRWKETDPWRSDKLRDCFAWDLMTNPTKPDINNNQAFSRSISTTPRGFCGLWQATPQCRHSSDGRNRSGATPRTNTPRATTSRRNSTYANRAG